MKALIYTQYGSPQVLELREVEKPTPRDDQVLVKVHAAALNSADLEYLKGLFLVRLDAPQKPMYPVLGTDIAGTVEAVGNSITQFQPGDAVYDDLTLHGFGALAEHVCVPEKTIARKPANLTFEQAAAVPRAGVIALRGVRDYGKIQPGQKVLMNGAGGGVGTFAVQPAKYYGAEVTAVDSGQKLDSLRSLGADFVLDYTREDFTKNGQRYDLILDVVAHRSILGYQRALTANGTFGMIGGSTWALLQAFFLGAWISKRGNQTLGVVMGLPTQDDLDDLRELLETNKIAPVIDKVYPFHATAEVFRYLESKQALGKVVITLP